MVERHVFRRRQRRGDVRLQDPVAALDPLAIARQVRLVVRMRGDADEIAQATRRQARIAVEREHVAHGVGDARRRAHVDERTGRPFGQHRQQLLELAALALPADPALLRFGEAALAMQQQEAKRPVRLHRIERVEPLDLVARRGEQCFVAFGVLACGVGPVGQQRELHAAFRIGEVVQLQLVRQLGTRGRPAEHGRYDDQRAVLVGDAGEQCQPRQAARPRRFADQPVDHRDRHLGGRNHEQHTGEPGPPWHGRAGRQGDAVVDQQPGDDSRRGGADRAQVDRQGHAAQRPSSPPRILAGQPDRRQQLDLARAVEPVARHRLRFVAFGRVLGGATHAVKQRFGDDPLALAALLAQFLDAVQRLVACVVAFGGEGRGAEHQLCQNAGRGDDVGPVGVADRAQRVDRVADAQVVGRLCRRQSRLDVGKVRRDAMQPIERDRRVDLGAMVLQALRHLRQERFADATTVEHREQLVEAAGRERIDAIAAEIGDLARRLVRGHALGEAAQVLDQHHAQGRRQGPQLAEREFAGRFVGLEEVDQQFFVEGAVGVRDEGPGDAVDARQADQRLVLQHRQIAEIAARQAVGDLAQLRFDQMEVVEQPFGRRAHVVAGLGLPADVVVRLAQDADVVAQARKEGGRSRGRKARGMGDAEADAMLGKAFGAEDFRAIGPLERAAFGIENVAQRRWCVGHQPQQFGRRHRWIRR